MPAAEWVYLVGGMLDLEHPEATEDPMTRLNRKLRAYALEAHNRARGRR